MRTRYLALLILLGCPKNDAPADAGTTTTTSASAAVSNATLAPIDDTATAATATAVVTATGVGTAHPTNMAVPTGVTGLKPLGSASGATTGIGSKLQACCAALRKQSQQQSAQAAQYMQAAALCDGLVAAVGNAGGAPQLEQIKPLLQGAQLPPLCQGL
jgi:hypothetical protein